MKRYPHCPVSDVFDIGPIGSRLFIGMAPFGSTIPVSHELDLQIQPQKPRIVLSTYEMIRNAARKTSELRSLLYLAMIAVVIVSSASNCQENAIKKPERTKLESGKAQDAVAHVNSVLRADITAAIRDDATGLATYQKVMQLASETQDNYEKYGLFEVAMTLAIRFKRFDLVKSALKEMDQIFEIDYPRLCISSLGEMSSTEAQGQSSVAQKLTDETRFLVKSLVEEGRTEDAKSLLEYSKGVFLRLDAAAKNSKSAISFIELRSEFKEIVDYFDDVQKQAREGLLAIKRLESNPQNAWYTYQVGMYFCFVRNNWTKGLELLKLSNVAPLSAIASTDLDCPDDPARALKLADSWWAFSQSQYGIISQCSKERARIYYRIALPALKGLEKVAIENKLVKYICATTIEFPGIALDGFIPFQVRWKGEDGQWRDWVDQRVNSQSTCLLTSQNSTECRIRFDSIGGDNQITYSEFELKFKKRSPGSTLNAYDGRPYRFEYQGNAILLSDPLSDR